MNKIVSFILMLLVLGSCQDDKPLPILGEPKMKDGKEVPHYISDFEFTNQNNKLITNKELEKGIYVADFFFTKCPSICPVVTTQMLRIYEKFENENVNLVSFTMDPVRDTPPVLKDYADRIAVDAPKWQFLTGDKDKLHQLAPDLFSIIIEDGDVPGGFDHSGKLILVDKEGQIRAFCEGTDEDDVTDFMKDIKKLLLEDEK